MKVLIIGGGGREHALGWKLVQSPLQPKLYFAPGNPGCAQVGECVALKGDALVAFAREQGVALVVVGPEQPLVDGIADQLAEAGIPCFGPGSAAARLEGSKDFAKDVMVAAGVPTAKHRTFTDVNAALDYVRGESFPLVVKADGLAAGKGVTICTDLAQAEAALRATMAERKFGEAGDTVVIEEFLEGVEASFHLICDGERVLPLPAARDHKALLEGDQGPNTGGMGTYAPSPLIDVELAETIQHQICKPVLRYLRDQGAPFRGVLFTGLMLTESGPKVLEFNVRFGDPETQVMMPLLDFDLLPVLQGAARGLLPEGEFPVAGAATCVVLAAEGYPESPRKGDTITGLPEDPDHAQVFCAGVAQGESGELRTSGGRVMGVTAWADDLATARQRAYHLTETIHFDGMHYRKDIGGF